MLLKTVFRNLSSSFSDIYNFFCKSINSQETELNKESSIKQKINILRIKKKKLQTHRIKKKGGDRDLPH